MFWAFALLAVIGYALWITRDKHTWTYLNPYDRICKVCKRHEVHHCWGEDLFMSNAAGWWEVFYEGIELMPCSEEI